MRSPLLYPLFADVASLPRVGKQTAKLLTKLCGATVKDILFHPPASVLIRRHITALRGAGIGEKIILPLTAVRYERPASKGKPMRVWLEDSHGIMLQCLFFHGDADYWQRQLPIGSLRLLSGTLEQQGPYKTLIHPDYIVPPDAAAQIPAIEPIYPLTTGLYPKTLRHCVSSALERAPALPEWLDGELCRRHGWPHWLAALKRLHQPASADDINPTSPARLRLAFDELLAHQLAMLQRHQHESRTGRSLAGNGLLQQKFLASLPYQRTAGQQAACDDITTDMAASRKMLRLIQGDVGCGKTVVAFYAALQAIESGAQAALMAPTEILAQQHYDTMQPWAQACGITIELLTGRTKQAERTRILADVASGAVQLLLGTHALFQDSVLFQDLGLAIVDEQHRFGVEQRLSLSRKGHLADLLVMTATPIPRTLLLAGYGDMDISAIPDKPPGRLPVLTTTLPLEKLPDLVARLRTALEQGEQAYWVCPLVEESDKLDIAAVEARYTTLQNILGDCVGMVHGRMKGEAKDAQLQAFIRGDTRLLLATTVIEVGVNVPQATIMVIEHAERFGLAQLHQLRGRVGRGNRGGKCVLVFGQPLSAVARERLTVLRQTSDGFVIAEKDLVLRGYGDVLGTKQSGLPSFRFVDLAVHSDWLTAANQEARLILHRDPTLTSERGQAIQLLLQLHEKDSVHGYVQAG